MFIIIEPAERDTRRPPKRVNMLAFFEVLVSDVFGKCSVDPDSREPYAVEGAIDLLREPGGHLGRVLGGLGAILERLFEQFNFGSIF